jgi:hypothetical protein
MPIEVAKLTTKKKSRKKGDRGMIISKMTPITATLTKMSELLRSF